MFYQGLIGPLGMGQRVRKGEIRWLATELRLILWNWIWRNEVEMKICRYPGYNLQPPFYFPFSLFLFFPPISFVRFVCKSVGEILFTGTCGPY